MKNLIFILNADFIHFIINKTKPHPPPPLQPRRLSFGGFGTLRKKRSDDSDEYVCPMNVATPTSFHMTKVQSYQEEELEQVRSSALSLPITNKLKLRSDEDAVL